MFQFPQLDPVAIDFGFLQIRWYGISYVAGLLTGWWLLHQRARHQPLLGWTTVQVSDLIFYGTVGILVGGRLGSVLFYNLPYYLENPLEILMIQRGGMSFHGGMIGVIAALWYYSRKIDQTFFETTDFIVPVAPVGLFFGRIANFINGELWGTRTDVPWAVIYPTPDGVGIARHPSQLYEAFLEGIVLFLVLWIYSSRIRPKMAVSGLFLLGYGTFRTLVEFFRQPDAEIGYLAGDWLTMGMMLSFPMAIAGIVLLLMAYHRDRIRSEK